MRAIHPNTTVTNYPFEMRTKTTIFQFGSFRSPEKHDSGLMPGRTYSSEAYIWGFNGMQKDDEISGGGNNLDFGARIYDSRLGRWMSVDGLIKKYPQFSGYIFSINSPLFWKDIQGYDIIPTVGFYKSSKLEPMVMNFINCENNILTSKYLCHYMGPNGTKDLVINYGIVQGNQEVESKDIIAATNAHLSNANKEVIRFNSFGIYDRIGHNGYSNELAEFKVVTELGLANAFIHEVIYHASNHQEIRDHAITTEMFDDAIKAIEQYSMEHLNKKLTKEESISLAMQGLESNTSKLLEYANERYKEELKMPLTTEKANAINKSLTSEVQVLDGKKTLDEQIGNPQEDGKEKPPIVKNTNE